MPLNHSPTGSASGNGARAAEVPGHLTGSACENKSGIRHLPSDIWHPVSGIWYLVSGRLGDELRQVFGGWANDPQSRARGRVGEGERGSVEQGTIRLTGPLRAVQSIPQDRKAGGGEMDSNLVRSSGDQKTSDGRQTAVEPRQDLHFGSRRPAALVAAEAPPVAAVAGDGAIDLEGVRGWMAFHNGEVGTLDQALGPRLGEGSQGGRITGEEHRAAGQTVETVEHPQEWPPPAAESECEQHLVIEGWIVVRSVLGRLGEHTCRFGRDQ
jgi:hypothetical protein